MMEFFTKFGPTLVIGGILLAVVAAIVIHLIRQKRSGGCGCGCSDCPSKGICHPDQH